MKRLLFVLALVLLGWNLARIHSRIQACSEPTAATVISVADSAGGGHSTVTVRRGPHGNAHIALVQEPPAPAAPSAPVAPQAPAPPPAHAESAEPAEAVLAVDILPTPAWYLDDDRSSKPATDLRGMHTVKGRQSVTKERAEGDAHRRLETVVAEWLRPEIPRTWQAPRHFVDAMILDRYVEPVEHDYGLTYKAGYRVNYAPETRDQIVQAYYREVGTHRMVALGGVLAFVLVCLAALSGYIRADEATKGYYTNRLRVVTALAVGVAGGALLHLLG